MQEGDSITIPHLCSAYKRLLVRHSIMATGNDITRDETHTLDILRDSSSETDAVVSCSAVNLALRYEMTDMPACVAVMERSYSETSQVIHHSKYKEAVVAYIAGYVVNMAKMLPGSIILKRIKVWSIF